MPLVVFVIHENLALLLLLLFCFIITSAVVSDLTTKKTVWELPGGVGG